jgi:hypothetical protein
MRCWERTPVERLCGRCAQQIPINAPVLVLTLPGIKRPMIRGECCAGHAPPIASEPLVVRHRTTKPMAPLKLVASRKEYLPYKD